MMGKSCEKFYLIWLKLQIFLLSRGLSAERPVPPAGKPPNKKPEVHDSRLSYLHAYHNTYLIPIIVISVRRLRWCSSSSWASFTINRVSP